MERISKIIILSVFLTTAAAAVGWAISPHILDEAIKRTIEPWNGYTQDGAFNYVYDNGAYNYLVTGTYLTKRTDLIYVNTSYGLVTISTAGFKNNKEYHINFYKECTHQTGDRVKYAVFATSMYRMPDFYLKRELC